MKSKQTSPELPRHIAIIMDGNGRWAKRRVMPRAVGHKSGANVFVDIVKFCSDLGIESLTMFAFSSENWTRPQREVGVLMDLMLRTLRGRIQEFHEKNAIMKFIGDRSEFSDVLLREMEASEELTKNNTGLKLNVAVSYGGRQDIALAAKAMAEKVAAGELQLDEINESLMGEYVSLSDQPEPDLFIRTGGEIRISNFLLWQLAYTELYFTDTLWPDFDQAELMRAIEWFAGRDRRFGGLNETKG